MQVPAFGELLMQKGINVPKQYWAISKIKRLRGIVIVQGIYDIATVAKKDF